MQFITAGVVYTILLLIAYPTMPALDTVGNKAWIGILFLIVFNSIVAFMLQNVMQRYARPTNAALIISTEAIFGAFAAYFLGGEEFKALKIIGCILVFLGIMYYQIDFKVFFAKKQRV